MFSPEVIRHSTKKERTCEKNTRKIVILHVNYLLELGGGGVGEGLP